MSRPGRRQRRDGIRRVHLGLQVAPALVARLEALAARRGVGLSEVAEDAIAAGIAAGMVDDALADVGRPAWGGTGVSDHQEQA